MGGLLRLCDFSKSLLRSLVSLHFVAASLLLDILFLQHMAAPYLSSLDGLTSSGLDSPLTPGGDTATSRRVNALSTKLTSVLSSSFADYEIRDALRLLDERGVENDEDTRRNLKLNAQKEVIDCDAKIVDDFGKVAEVRCQHPNAFSVLVGSRARCTATETCGRDAHHAECNMCLDARAHSGRETRIRPGPRRS